MTTQPKYGEKNFTCPHCGVTAQQIWFGEATLSGNINELALHSFLDYRRKVSDYQQETIQNFLQSLRQDINNSIRNLVPSKFAISTCVGCKDISIWIERSLIHPRKTSVPSPNEDMNGEIKELYHEAEKILHNSPKGATALLRLALQLLLKQLGKEGNNINTDIKNLVSEGLSPKIQQALDILRVVGNNAVHPGQINLDDNKEIATRLFTILNFITEELITKPKELESIYNEIIPQETQEHIRQRDSKSKP